MRPIYSRGRILLAPSQREEGWGRVVTEAQVSGIPVIASKIRGLPESVGPGGILVDPVSDLSRWEHALAQMWDHQDEYDRYSRAARAHAGGAEFDSHCVLSTFMDFLAKQFEAGQHRL